MSQSGHSSFHWISSQLLKSLESDGTSAHRLYHNGAVWVERLGSDVIISHPTKFKAERLINELHSWADQNNLSLQRIYTRLRPDKEQGRVEPVVAWQNESSEELPLESIVEERNLKVQVIPSGGYASGIFIDQRENRRYLETLLTEARFKITPPTLLNLFAYTAIFSLAAARYGAITTSVDLSKQSLDRGKSNFPLNEINPAPHKFIADDALKVLPRLLKREEQYDFIILDPPTFSRSKKTGVFRIERAMPELIDTCLKLLSPQGSLLVSTNCTSLDAKRLKTLSKERVSKWQCKAEYKQLPPPEDIPFSHMPSTIWIHLK